MMDSRKLVYFAVTHHEYAQRHSREMLGEMETQLATLYPDLGRDGKEPPDINSRFLVEIAEKYKNPKNFDKLAEANLKLGAVMVQVQGAIKKTMNARENVEV